MSARTILLTPIDAWFFRDGRPYNQRESGQTDVRSLFPPFAPTVVGTLRAALARGQGWSGRESWADKLHSILGNGFDDLGQLQFHGPFLVRNGKCLFPVPLHLRMGASPDKKDDDGPSWLPSALMTPAPESAAIECDLGRVRFPIAVQKSPNLSALDPIDLWVTVEGYEDILRGRKPDIQTLFQSNKLWQPEPRVGLARDHDRRAAEEGALYSPQYVRLLKGVGLVSVIEGIPTAWKKFPDLIAFGGESRMACCEPLENKMFLPQLLTDMIRESNRFTVSLLSPLCLLKDSSGRLASPMPGQSFPGLTGSTVVSACVGRPVHIGGWNSLKREPLPLIPYLPAGSTWFCESDPAALDSVLTLHGHHVGERTPYGFGQIALGAWPQETGDAA